MNFNVALEFVVKVTIDFFVAIFLSFKILLFGRKLFADCYLLFHFVVIIRSQP